MVDETKNVEVGYVPSEIDEVGDFGHHEMGRVDKASVGSHKKGSLKKLQHDLEKAQKEVVALKEERDDLKDKYLRTLADFDNFRKRMRKEKEEYQQYHLAEFLSELLQVVDNLERALKVQKDDMQSQSIRSGVEMIFKMMLDLLKRFGVDEIVAEQRPFDPAIHQALSKSEDPNVTEPLVTEVYQKGFYYNSKLLRPTLVRVSLPGERVADTAIEKG